jgi:uncharacterized protein (DUF1015 family)
MGSHTQYGLVGCASVEEYRNDTIKKHELTRQDKEDDRCQHIRITNSHSGPIFLTYRDVPEINSIVDSIKSTPPENDHIASDGVRHQCWVIKSQDTISKLCLLFNSIPNLYVADGHHRTAAAARVGRERKDANPNHTGNEEYNFFLAVFFPASQLQILDYNRAVKDLYGLTEAEFLKQSEAHFEIQESDYQVKPTKKGEFGCYLKNRWYKFIAKEHLRNISDPVLKLDVSILQNYVLAPILGVADPRTDKRIDFIGGTRGLGELERHVNSGEMKIAFSLYPTSVEELMSIANTGKVMPPKSTWFEPKLRDGLFVHFF